MVSQISSRARPRFNAAVTYERSCSGLSSAVSTAMVISEDAEFKLAWIKEGSLLDDDNLALVAELCGDAGYQVVVERVGEHDDDAITFCNGEAKER